ncbi:hypothetical protein CHS0354_006473 [Potamilus streckersoni]|uniref:Mitochondrial ribosomal protein S18C n=1 Tax=Potamilus streckersoni TaxID=2493646 RepID=A0AAE0TA27_9BIVA|nr:hypothetical protein CHS0354_006473 [Potamilus streckersoni]
MVSVAEVSRLCCRLNNFLTINRLLRPVLGQFMSRCEHFSTSPEEGTSKEQDHMTAGDVVPFEPLHLPKNSWKGRVRVSNYSVRQKTYKWTKAVTPTFNIEEVETVLKKMEKELVSDNDQPVPNMPNPYVEKDKKCIICQYNIDLNYKNARLLSQFVSPFTGRIYGRQITGLCIPMQKEIARLIKCARKTGFMSVYYKKADYLADPKLFNAFKPQR